VESFDKLVWLMERLRSDAGCPWDRKQEVSAFKTFMLEEVYEIIEAIEKDDMEGLKEELGDLLFHIVFVAQICRERGAFDITEVVDSVYHKMYNRHPHVFQKDGNDEPIETRWEEIKKGEKDDYSLLANIPPSMPALLRAYVITKRASRVGFDWERIDDVYEKISEEVGELKEAQVSGRHDLVREEVGDLLFTIVNIARFLDVDPEDALRSTSDKFVKRFGYIEKKTDIRNASLDTMDRLWNESKSMEDEEGQPL